MGAISGTTGLLLVFVLAGCAASASSARAIRGAEQLSITVRGGEFGDRSYTLGCDPAAGTVPRPSAACVKLHAHPELLQPHPGQGHRCPPGTPTYEIAGTSDGAPVSASFSGCVSGQEAGLTAWKRLVSYSAPVLHGRATLKLDAGIGPLRLGRNVDAVEHGASGQLLGPSRVAYRLGDRGILLTEYGSDLRITRIEPNIAVDIGNLHFKRWRHFICRPGRLYRHSTGAKWTTVFVDRTRPNHVGRVIVGAGTAPRSCSDAGLAPLSPSH